MDNEAVWISEANVTELISLPEAIPALERGLALEAAGKAVNMAKTHATWNQGRSTLHAIGAVMDGAGVSGTKVWSHTPGGACPLLVLFNSDTGALMAMIEAFALGQMRTAGISGVATRWMAEAGADDMALIGTGKQALTQLAGIIEARPLKRLRVYSPQPANRDAFIEKVRGSFSFKISAAETVEQAVHGASIVTLVTRAREPFLSASMLSRGCHVNAIGAIIPERREFGQDIFDRCGLIVVDSLDSVKRLSSEFMERFGSSDAAWSQVQPLSRLVENAKERPTGVDLTLFKAMGMGLSDVSLGLEILERAKTAGVGRMLPQPRKKTVRVV